MANCVLCGKKVGLLDQIELDFHGSKQILCSACDVRMSKASPGERQDLEQEILVSPYLQKADTVQANVNTGKICPACGAVLERKLENFSIGADGGGGLMTLLADHYEVDLYACPQCGKVELYTAAPGAWAALTDQPEAEQVTCPDCGTRHSPLIGCPSCAVRQAGSGRTFPQEEKQSTSKRSKKVPWEK